MHEAARKIRGFTNLVNDTNEDVDGKWETLNDTLFPIFSFSMHGTTFSNGVEYEKQLLCSQGLLNHHFLKLTEQRVEWVSQA